MSFLLIIGWNLTREKLEGKRTAALCWTTRLGRKRKKKKTERERRIKKRNGEVVWVLFKSSNLLPATKTKGHLWILYCIIQYHSPSGWLEVSSQAQISWDVLSFIWTGASSMQSLPDLTQDTVIDRTHAILSDLHRRYMEASEGCCYKSGPSSEYVSHFWLFNQHGETRLFRLYLGCCVSFMVQLWAITIGVWLSTSCQES